MLVSDPLSSYCSSPSSSVTYKLDPGLTVVEGATPDYPTTTPSTTSTTAATANTTTAGTTAPGCGTITNTVSVDNGLFNGSIDPQTLMILDPTRDYPCACPSLSSSEVQAWAPTEADLMDHYKKACKELMSAYGPPGLTDERVWQDYIPSLVQSVPYLAHSFYAITAVHMMTMCKNRPGVEKYALDQFFRAMEEFEKLVAEPATSSTGEQEHSEAVFLATVFLMMLAFTFESAVPMFSQHPGEVDVLTLVRGPLIVARSMYPLLDDTSVVSSLRPGEFPTPDAGSESPFGGPTVYDVLLNACSDLVLGGYLSQDHANVCRRAIEDLKVSVRNSCRHASPVGLVAWEMCLSAEFLSLVRQGHEFARLITCYHLAGLCAIRQLFWVGQRPAREIINITNQLQSWPVLIQWPLSMIDNDKLNMTTLWDHALCN